MESLWLLVNIGTCVYIPHCPESKPAWWDLCPRLLWKCVVACTVVSGPAVSTLIVNNLPLLLRSVIRCLDPKNRGRYHGPSSDDNLHSPTVIPPSALDKTSAMKRYHRQRTCSHTLPRRSPTMVTLRGTRFVECRWWNDGWTVAT